MLRKIVFIILLCLTIIFTLCVLLINLRLYYPSNEEYGFNRVGKDIIPQLNFIKLSLMQGAARQMQVIFPEGYFFMYTLCGLAWVEVEMRPQLASNFYNQALTEARWAFSHLDSEQGRAPFSSNLNPPYGVFYLGWRTWLLGGIIKLQPEHKTNKTEQERFVADCALLADAFDKSPTPFLCSYPHQSWPVDSVVAIAALCLHDSMFEPRYTLIIENWLKQAKTLLDSSTGLLAHKTDPLNGKTIIGARASSQSIILRFLFEIDPVWALNQYRLFRKNFITQFLGLPGVREYPHDQNGRGDVDSGPLIAGISASTTVVTIGTALCYNDREIADSLMQTTETFGLPLHLGHTKSYVFGILPIGDTFLVWAKTARPWLSRIYYGSFGRILGWWWRWPVHVITLLFLAGLWLPFVIRVIRLRKKYSQD